MSTYKLYKEMNMRIDQILALMAPTTLVAFISDLSMTILAPNDGRVDWMLRQALEALFANAGDDAIKMLEDADYCVTHPVIAAVIAEWREMA
jgi:hypothetical protein